MSKKPYTCLLVDTDTRFLRSVGEQFHQYREDVILKLESNFGNVIESLTVLKPSALVLNWDNSNTELRDIILRECHKVVKDIKVIALLNEETQIDINPAKWGVARTIRKPFPSDMLLRLVTSLFEESEDGQLTEGYLKSFSLSSFLQVLHMEKKTCEIKIESSNSVGTMWLVAGNVVDAELNGKNGFEASIEILMSDTADLTILPVKYKKKKVINPLSI